MPILKFTPVDTPVKTFELSVEWMIGDADGYDYTKCLVEDEAEAVRRYKLVKECIDNQDDSDDPFFLEDEPWAEKSFNTYGDLNRPYNVALFWYDESGKKFKVEIQ